MNKILILSMVCGLSFSYAQLPRVFPNYQIDINQPEQMSVLPEALQNNLREISRSVGHIYCENISREGTGFLERQYDGALHVVTAHHAVKGKSLDEIDQCELRLPEGQIARFRSHKFNQIQGRDIFRAAVEGKGIENLGIEKSFKQQLGSQAQAMIGFREKSQSPHVALGHVLGKWDDDAFFMSTLSGFPGQSGAPIFNITSEQQLLLTGVTSWIPAPQGIDISFIVDGTIQRKLLSNYRYHRIIFDLTNPAYAHTKKDNFGATLLDSLVLGQFKMGTFINEVSMDRFTAKGEKQDWPEIKTLLQETRDEMQQCISYQPASIVNFAEKHRQEWQRATFIRKLQEFRKAYGNLVVKGYENQSILPLIDLPFGNMDHLTVYNLSAYANAIAKGLNESIRQHEALERGTENMRLWMKEAESIDDLGARMLEEKLDDHPQKQFEVLFAPHLVFEPF